MQVLLRVHDQGEGVFLATESQRRGTRMGGGCKTPGHWPFTHHGECGHFMKSAGVDKTWPFC